MPPPKDAAVAAARRAFEGAWRLVKPVERQQMLLKLADPVERHFDELATIETLDIAAPISRTSASRPRVVAQIRRQMCIAAGRRFVGRRIYDEFVARAAAVGASLKAVFLKTA